MSRTTSFAQLDSCSTPVNIIANGSFTAGYTSFISSLPQNCGCLYTSYCIDTITTNKCSGWASFHAPSGSGNFMIIDGDPQNPAVVWSQAGIAVSPNRWYTFSFMARNVYSINLFNLEFRIDDGTSVQTAPTSNITAGAWVRYTTAWFSGAATAVDLSINIPVGGHYRDFGMDDVFFGFCKDTNTGIDDAFSMQEKHSASVVANPFSSELDVRVLVKSSSTQDVMLSVYDATGRLMSSTINQQALAPGDHLLKLDASSWKEGIYFYAVTIGDELITGKAVRIK